MTVQSTTLTVQLDGSNQPKPLDISGAAVGFTTTRYVVISNLTPYVMVLKGIRDQPESQASLAPGTANKFAWTNQYGDLIATWVNPIIGAPASTPQVIVEYSDDPHGADIVGSYPTTLQSGVTNIGSIIGPVTITGSVAVSSISGTVTVAGNVNVTGGTINATITNASIPVTGSVNANITNATLTVGGSVSITGTPTVSITGTTNVNVTGGTIGISSGTVSISGNVTVGQIIDNVNVNLAVETVASGTWNPTLNNPLNVTVTLNQQVQGFKLLLSIASANVQNIEANLINNTNQDLQVVDVQLSTSFPQMGAQTGFVVIPFTVAGDVGDNVQLSLAKLAGGGAAANVSYALIGVGVVPAVRHTPGLPLENFPVGGMLRATANPNNSSVVLLAAPPTGMAYRLQAVMAQDAASLNLLGTTSGRPYGFVAASATLGAPPVDRLEGQLCIEGLTVFANRNVVVSLYYDLVSIPTIL